MSSLVRRVLAPVLVIGSLVAAAPAASASQHPQEAVGFRIPAADGSPHGWIGSYRRRSDSPALYCGDPRRPGPSAGVAYGRAARVGHWRLLSGRPVRADDLRRTGWILSRYGDTGHRRRAAAVDTAVYALTSGGTYGWGGVRSEQRLRATGHYSEVKRLARNMLAESARLAGSYSVFAAVATVADNGDVAVVAGVRSGGGTAVPGVRVRVDFDGDAAGATTAVTNGDGEAYLTFRASRPGSYAVRASASGLPTSELWAMRPHDGRAQRLFVSGRTTSAAATDDLVVKAHPRLSTRVTPSVGAPGGAVRDLVRVSGLLGGYGRVAQARLFGPFADRRTMVCTSEHLRAAAPVRISGDGVWSTASARVARAGFYTWQVAVPGDAYNLAAGHPCGVPAETTLQRRPPYAPPTISSGFSGVAGSRSRVPSRAVVGRLRVPSLGVDAAVLSVGTRHRQGGPQMALPSDVASVGWLRPSAHADDRVGTAVIAGHVSDRHDRPGALYRLAQARIGRRVQWSDRTGSHRFVIVKVRTRSRTKPLPAGLFATTGAHRLVLVTCTGRISTGDGGFHYTRNVIVVARELPR